MFAIQLTIWALWVMPNPSPSIPDPKEFEVRSVYFETAADCNNAGIKWIQRLANTAHQHHGGKPQKGYSMDWQKDKAAPPDVAVTFTCIERDRW